ncbi:hypothetical protein QBC47DRAFT_289932 [Echria macrotheca]|uniref:Uncharacterized protein n=1 Tax=Echria macrotheca TaxID=438768 RepID=A0AAJ0BQI6_9PEZI|nr:hypothetical protein QBC47DRAFT_289932 [Echria macrotheca]
MTGRNNGFQEELARVARAHPDATDRFLIRSALMWLSVAKRPLRAYELWVALQVEESSDVRHIERLLTESSYVEEPGALTSLRRLLGGLITTQDAPDGFVYVELCKPELADYLFDLDEAGSPDSLAFSRSQAHILAASVSMAICSVTTMHLAHIHGDNTASSLVLYAWTHWSEHLCQSGYALSDNHAAGLADSMIFRVCTDLLVLLLALNDFVTGPITFSIMHDQARCAALVRDAHEVLEKPLAILSTISPDGEYCRALHAARQIFDASKQLRRGRSRDTSPPLLPVSPRMQSLRMDRLVGATGHLFGDGERHTIRDLSDLARGLRRIALVFAQAPLYEELLKEYRREWSPLDVLVHAAGWAENMASYPFWEELEGGSHYLLGLDPSDVYYNTASLVLSRVRQDPAAVKEDDTPWVGGSIMARAPPIPPSISTPRWAAASIIYNIKSLGSWFRPTGTFTVNHPRFLARRVSSFSRLPLRMQTAGLSPFFFADVDVRPFIPTNLRHLYRRRVSTFLTRVTSSEVLKTLDEYSSGWLSSGPMAKGLADTFPEMRTALLSHGYRAALAQLVGAIVLNHLRRMWTPWLASYTWYSPLEDLRLALSDNPAYFLEETLSTSWAVLLFSQMQKPALDTLASLLLRFITSPSHPHHPPHQFQTLPPTHHKTNPESYKTAAKILYLTWTLATIEYILTRALYTTAFLLSPLPLLTSFKSIYHLIGILFRHPIKLLLLAYQTYTYTVHGLIPLVAGSILCACAGQPGLFLLFSSVACTVWSILRWRSFFLMMLEVSGLFIALGFLVAGVGILGRELVKDPIGLKASTAAARRRGIQGRSVLPRGAVGREGILRR